MAKHYSFEVVCHPDHSAGMLGYSDDITIIVDSDNPGGEPGEFEEFMQECLAEWFDGANIRLTHGVFKAK